MLDVFSLIFLADTKISFRYDFVAPLVIVIGVSVLIQNRTRFKNLKC